MRRPVALVLSCEHGGNRVPREVVAAFVGAAPVLASHRGFDAGALPVARELARRFEAPLFAATVSRLVVDLNRSETHPRVLSEFTHELAPVVRQRLLARWHRPHRAAIVAAIGRIVARGVPVVHVAVHSFTPVLDGVERNADVGLLYDPARRRERELCGHWRAALHAIASSLRVRLNYPYRGVSDGLTTALRRRFADRDYAGIELEMNQAWVADARRFSGLRRAIGDSLAAVLAAS